MVYTKPQQSLLTLDILINCSLKFCHFLMSNCVVYFILTATETEQGFKLFLGRLAVMMWPPPCSLIVVPQ